MFKPAEPALTATLPATLSYVTAQKEGAARESAYHSEFAVIYDGPAAVSGFWPHASMEGRLTSSGEQKAADALRLRFGGYRMVDAAKLGEGTELVANLKYETEHQTGTKKGLIEFGVTPIFGWLGAYWPGPPKLGQADAAGNYVQLPWIQVAPTVSLGADVGKTFDVGSSTETKETVVRLSANIRLDAELNALSAALGTQSVRAYAQGSYWHLPREDEVRDYRIGRTGVTFGLTDVLSFDLAYTVGREPPTYTFSRSATAGFGLKF